MTTLSQIAKSQRSDPLPGQPGYNTLSGTPAYNPTGNTGGGRTPAFDPLPGQPGYNTLSGTSAYGVPTAPPVAPPVAFPQLAAPQPIQQAQPVEQPVEQAEEQPLSEADAKIQSAKGSRAVVIPTQTDVAQNVGGVGGVSTFDPERSRAGFQAAKEAGAQAPGTIEEAAKIIGEFTPQAEEPDQIQSCISQDPFLNQVVLAFQQFMGEQNQRASLVEEYQSLLKESGVQELDTELLDMKQVIEGAEDDIRQEISAAGGLGTESQVLALTNARNKQLIKNYNALLETRNSKEKYLNTMMNLTVQDRQAADQRFDTMMNFGFQIADLQQRMKTNAIAGIERMVNTIGWNGIVDSLESPYEVGLLERTYGLPQGGLQQAAQRESAGLAFGQEERELDLALKRKQLAGGGGDFTLSPGQIRYDAQGNIVAEGGEAPGKAPTATQFTAAGFGSRMKTSDGIITKFSEKGLRSPGFITGKLPSFLKSGDRQQFEQAERDFINAVLRKESGAAIAESEFDSARKQYIPQPNDKIGVLLQKEANRALVTENMLREAGAAVPGGTVVGEPDIEGLRSQLRFGEFLVRNIQTGNIEAMTSPEFVANKYEAL